MKEPGIVEFKLLPQCGTARQMKIRRKTVRREAEQQIDDGPVPKAQVLPRTSAMQLVPRRLFQTPTNKHTYDCACCPCDTTEVRGGYPVPKWKCQRVPACHHTCGRPGWWLGWKHGNIMWSVTRGKDWNQQVSVGNTIRVACETRACEHATRVQHATHKCTKWCVRPMNVGACTSGMSHNGNVACVNDMWNVENSTS